MCSCLHRTLGLLQIFFSLLMAVVLPIHKWFADEVEKFSTEDCTMVCNICVSSLLVILMCEDNIYGVPSMTGPSEDFIFQGLRLESQDKLEAPKKSMFLDLGLSWLDYANWCRVFTKQNFIDYRRGMLWAMQGLKGGVPKTKKYLQAAMQIAEKDGSWKIWQCRSFAGAWLMDYLYGLVRKHQGLTKTKSLS